MKAKRFLCAFFVLCMRKQAKKMRTCRLYCLILTLFLLGTLSGCGHDDASMPEFPPTLETMQAAADKLHWTVDQSGTQSWHEDHILYSLAAEDQTKLSVSCALADGNRILMENCVLAMLPDKPQFDWKDWEKTVTLAETLYGGISAGELYQALTAQDIPKAETSSELDAPTGQEALSWEITLPAVYGRVRWSISAGTVDKNFPSPIIRDWRMSFSISLYESKEAYARISAAS